MIQELVGQVGPARRHEVDGLHRTQRHHIVVAVTVSGDAHRLHRQEYGEGLAGLVVEVMLAQFLNEDVLGQAADIVAFLVAQQLGDSAAKAHPHVQHAVALGAGVILDIDAVATMVISARERMYAHI